MNVECENVWQTTTWNFVMVAKIPLLCIRVLLSNIRQLIAHLPMVENYIFFLE